MRWWDKPLTGVGRGVVLLVICTLMAFFDVLMPDSILPAGYETVFRGAEWLPLRYAGYAGMIYAVVLIVRGARRDQQRPAKGRRS